LQSRSRHALTPPDSPRAYLVLPVCVVAHDVARSANMGHGLTRTRAPSMLAQASDALDRAEEEM
jgi:hypothetical protein